jgi:D-glycero-alpha-D-manno-heptose-7-phosphate kinase
MDNFIISQCSTIRAGLAKIDLNGIGMVFIVDSETRVIGVASDGDIRSAMLDGSELSDSIQGVFNRDFKWSLESESREVILKLLDSEIKAIPLLDEDMRLVDVATANSFSLYLEKNTFARSKAPVRVSFSGGGSDLTHYFMSSNSGAVINATISLYCHSTLRPRNDKKIIINSFDLDQIIEYQHLDNMLSADDSFGLFRSLIKLIKPDFGFDLTVKSDFPPGSGLGGSSSVMVAVLGCFNEFRRDKWNDYELSEIAFQAERFDMGISGGWQDQYATVFGGFNFIEFKKDNNLIHPLRLQDKTILELEESLVLFEISSGRDSGSIHDGQKITMQDSKIQDLVTQNVNHSYDMKERILKGKLRSFGLGLNVAWNLKRQFSNKISNNELDELYSYALENGALGGKLLGAGGGGFFMFFVENFSKNSFLRSMKQRGFTETRFQFDEKGMQSWTIRDA